MRHAQMIISILEARRHGFHFGALIMGRDKVYVRVISPFATCLVDATHHWSAPLTRRNYKNANARDV